MFTMATKANTGETAFGSGESYNGHLHYLDANVYLYEREHRCLLPNKQVQVMEK